MSIAGARQVAGRPSVRASRHPIFSRGLHPAAAHRRHCPWWCRSWFNGNRTRQQVQRTGCRADLVGRDTQVLGRGGEAAMTEEELNGPQIGTGFEEMHSKCVPKRMRRDGFYETGETMRVWQA